MEDHRRSVANGRNSGNGGQAVMDRDCPRIAATYRLRTGDTPDSRWLVDAEHTVLLNESAAEILSRCDGERSVRALIEELQRVYVGAPEDEIVDGVWSFLALAIDKGWLEVRHP